MSQFNFRDNIPKINRQPVSALNLGGTDTTPLKKTLDTLTTAFRQTAKTKTQNDALKYMNAKVKQFMYDTRDSKDFSNENLEDFKTNLSDDVREHYTGAFGDVDRWLEQSLTKTLGDLDTAYGSEYSTHYFNDSMQEIRKDMNDGVDLEIVKSSSGAMVKNYNALYEAGYINASQLEKMSAKTYYDVLEYGIDNSINKELRGVTSQEQAEKIVKKYEKMNSKRIQELGGRGDEDVSGFLRGYKSYAKSLRSASALPVKLDGNVSIDGIRANNLLANAKTPEEVARAQATIKLANKRLKLDNTGDSVGVLVMDGIIPPTAQATPQYIETVVDNLANRYQGRREDRTPLENFENYMEETIGYDKNTGNPVYRKDKMELYPEGTNNFYALTETMKRMTKSQRIAFAESYSQGDVNIWGVPMPNLAMKNQMRNPYIQQAFRNSVMKAGGLTNADFLMYNPDSKEDNSVLHEIDELTAGTNEGDLKLAIKERGEKQPDAFVQEQYDSDLGDYMEKIRSLGGEHARWINESKETFNNMLLKASATGQEEKVKKLIYNRLREQFPILEIDNRNVSFPKDRLELLGDSEINSKAVKGMYQAGIDDKKYYFKDIYGNKKYVDSTADFTITNNGSTKTDYWVDMYNSKNPVYTINDKGQEVLMTSDVIADQLKLDHEKATQYTNFKTMQYRYFEDQNKKKKGMWY